MAVRLNALRKIATAFKKLDPNKLIKRTLDNTSIQQDIVDLNRIDQLYEKGITADGVSLGEYSARTIEGTDLYAGKKAKGQRYDHITLNDTGEFYETFAFENENGRFIITANTLKPDVDLLTYGNILGLTEKNKYVVAGWIRVPLIGEIKKFVLR